LDYKPASIYVREIIQETYGCQACRETVITAEGPSRIIDRGLPGAGLLAHVVVSKYQDHLPLNRQEHIFGRQGASVSRSTMADWMETCADLLSPLVKAAREDQLNSMKIHTDDTPVPVQDRTRKGKKIRTGRLWVYVGDDDHPHVVFDYTPDRSRDGPMKYLQEYKGHLQADAYKGYKAVYAGQKVVGVACWAHARRKFFDAQKNDPARSTLALSFIRSLYQVEWDAQEQNLDSDQRKALRQDRSRKILDQFHAWLTRESACTLPKSGIGQAIGYATRQWPDLVRYLEHGWLSIDNNAAERQIRRVAIGRNNWTFAGSDEGGRRAAVLYSLLATCQRHQVDPYVYIKDVLERISSHSANRVRDLLPDRWKELFGPKPTLTDTARGESAPGTTVDAGTPGAVD
jgi:transposase